ncbi:MAG TPA: pyridoxamine 5'-phosphate oxidase family protein [Oligoflexia bacterium]|nr:pyridoxamine 5'-phosphate oxidase family protein [Oligoflexia bacterium]HMR25307.1 pyridoxamine 5'-phosphate oxidase family protein [Oligoflexia bacterium]
MSQPAPSSRTQVKRRAHRGHYDIKTIYSIIDESKICHLAFMVEGYPGILPMAFCRVDDFVYFHSSSKNRMFQSLADHPQISLAFTHLDALVLARSAFHHSMNYRSVIVYGQAQMVTEQEEKLLASKALIDFIAPDRWPQIRHPNEQELKATGFFKVSLAEASAKIRTGPPVDDEADYALPVWAGIIPCSLKFEDPIPDPKNN